MNAPLSRRTLFRLLPGTLMGGKKVLDEVASGAVGTLAGGDFPPIPTGGGVTAFSGGRVGWALKRLAETTDPRIEAREKEWYKRPAALDPDLLACKSMSLAARSHLQAERNWQRHKREEKTYLEGIIDGLWD